MERKIVKPTNSHLYGSLPSPQTKDLNNSSLSNVNSNNTSHIVKTSLIRNINDSSNINADSNSNNVSYQSNSNSNPYGNNSIIKQKSIDNKDN